MILKYARDKIKTLQKIGQWLRMETVKKLKQV